MSDSPFDVIILGAGASGLMCAAEAGARGRRVLVLDHANKPGKKILMSGGGRCNFTNLEVEPRHYLSGNPHFVKSAQKRYTQWDFLGLVLERGIPYHERRHGQLFCDDSARDILDLLLARCDQAGVEIHTHTEVQTIQVDDAGFVLACQRGAKARAPLAQQFRGAKLVVATGGLSIPTMGASGFGYQVAEQFGHRIVPTRAGLVPLTFSGEMLALCQRLSGLALEVTVRCGSTQFTENLLFTHRGISGPAVLQISNYWRAGEEVQVDLLPSQEAQALLAQYKRTHPRSLLRTVLAHHLSKPLVAELESLWWPTLRERTLAEFPDAQLRQIAESLHGWSLKPSGTEGYRTAEVTLGGVSCEQVSSKTLESQLQPGLHFIGEVLDVTGWLGGYNFQWAWASAYACAEYL